MIKKTFKVKGMDCNSCANLIELTLKDKVKSVIANYSKGEVKVEFESNKISEKRIIGLIEKDGEFSVDEGKEKKIENKEAICWGFLGDFLGISWGFLGDFLGISW